MIITILIASLLFRLFAGSHGKHLVYNNLDKSSKDRFDSKFHKLQDVFLVNRTLIILDV